jgi:hypothetical protein
MLYLLQPLRQFEILVRQFWDSIALAVFLSVFASAVFGQGSSPVPTKLFGVTLGTTVRFDPNQNDLDVKALPAKAYRGIKKFLGEGVHLYIEPESAHERFPYIERKAGPEDTAYVTSYRLYLLPVVPSYIKTLDELKASALDWEVVTINWEMIDPRIEALDRDGPERKAANTDSYLWAANLCKTFEAEFNVKPEITDIWAYIYNCQFLQEDRMFEVDGGVYGRRLTLRYNKQVFDTKNDEVDKLMRQMEAKDLLNLRE